MEATKIFTKIKELGHNISDREELRKFCNLKLGQVCSCFQQICVLRIYINMIECINSMLFVYNRFWSTCLVEYLTTMVPFYWIVFLMVYQKVIARLKLR